MTDDQHESSQALENVRKTIAFIFFLKDTALTKRELAKRMDCSTRTIERYLKTVEELGYAVESIHSKPQTYRLASRYSLGYLSGAFQLDTAEIDLLTTLLSKMQLPLDKELELRRKLFIHSDLPDLPEPIFSSEEIAVAKCIHEAIEKKRQVQLHNYYSPHSETISSRFIEPIGFMPHDRFCIYAYEVKSSTYKIYKVDRVGKAELLLTPQATQHLPMPPPDAFGFLSHTRTRVRLRLTKFAHQLLREEFPQTRDRLTADPDTAYYFYDDDICDVRGIGRFILGMVGNIEIVEGDALRSYVRKRLACANF